MSPKKGNSGSFTDFLNALPSLNPDFSGGCSPEVTSPLTNFDSYRVREEQNPALFGKATPPPQSGILGQVLDNPVLVSRASPDSQSPSGEEGLSDTVNPFYPDLGDQQGVGPSSLQTIHRKNAKFYQEFLDLPEDRVTRGEEREWSCLPIIEPYDPQAVMLTEEDIPIPFLGRYSYHYSDSRNRPRKNIALENVRRIKSEMSAGHICRLHWYGFFPQFVQFRAADELERACSVPEDGVDWYPIYGDYIEIGLRFPIPDFLKTILNFYGIALTQLTPNAVQEVLAFAALCFMQSIQCSAELFEFFYELRGVNKQEGFYQIHKRGDNRRLFKGAKTGHGNWRTAFFFMRSGSEVHPLNHNTVWAKYTPPTGKYVPSAEVHAAHLELIKDIPADTSLDIMAITSPEMLIFAGLYPYKLGIGIEFVIEFSVLPAFLQLF